LAILYLGAYFISYFLGNYLRFLVVNESSVAVMPEKEILSSGMKQTALFTAGGLCILLLTANIQWAAYLFSLVGKVLLAILKWLVSLLSKEETEEVEELVMTSNQGMSDMGGLGEAGDPALIWVILEKILMFLVTVGVAVVFVVVIVMICRYIWKQFHNVKVVEQEKLQKGRDVREVCGIERNTRESAVIWSPFLNNRERVRKVYRKQILKNKFHIIGNHNVEDLKCMTAKECCDKISEESGSANCLKKIYEKARYSSYEVTSEDVKNMKAAVK